MLEATNIRLIVSDVDGVWTDGRITYSDQREIKSFNVRDGLGVKLAQRAGIDVVVLTSRTSLALERRCRELGVTEIVQGASNKFEELNRIVRKRAIPFDAVCYIGDDLPDLAPMRVVGVSAAPADACAEVLAAAQWKLSTPGGRGAFRELVERLLKARGEWKSIVDGFDAATLAAPKV